MKSKNEKKRKTPRLCMSILKEYKAATDILNDKKENLERIQEALEEARADKSGSANEIEQELYKAEVDYNEHVCKVTDALRRAYGALEKAGFSLDRARDITIGVKSGMSERNLRFIASDRFDNYQAEQIMNALGPKNTTIKGQLLSPAKVKRIANMGLPAENLKNIFTCMRRGKPNGAMELFFDRTLTAEKQELIMVVLYVERAPVELVRKYAGKPFTDSQFEVITSREWLYSFQPSTIRNFDVYNSPLRRAVSRMHDNDINDIWGWPRLTESQIDVFAKPKLSYGLMLILRLALHAGLTNEQVAKYAKPGISPKEAHDAFMDMLRGKTEIVA